MIKDPERRKMFGRIKSRRYNLRVRRALIAILGGKCNNCGFSDSRALQVDHISGNGHIDRKEMIGMENVQYLKRILSGSKDYQLLCANCNWIKRSVNKEVMKRI